MLRINNLHVSIENKPILQGVSLDVDIHEIHAIMGPNGGGKSTLAQVLAGHPDYQVTAGSIRISKDMTNWHDVLAMTPDERFHAGIFLSFQYPTEIAGVNLVSFLRQAVNEKLEKSGKKRLSPLVIKDVIKATATRLGFKEDLSQRLLNMGFSGGEKKKLEILQMSLLQPDYIILDEPDSGLDVDALRLIAEELEFQMTQRPFALIIITHYQKILDYIQPDAVHVLMEGKIVKHGTALLAKEIEQKGYEQFKPKH